MDNSLNTKAKRTPLGPAGSEMTWPGGVPAWLRGQYTDNDLYWDNLWWKSC